MPALHAESDDAARELVHHDQYPTRSQCCRLAPEQIAAPQTVFHVPEKREPGRTCRIRLRPVMNIQDAANNILVDLHAEGRRNLLRNSGTAPAGITPFHFNDGVDQFFTRSLGTRLTPAFGGKQQAVLSFGQHVVQMQQSGRLQYDGRAEKTSGAHDKGAQTGDETIRGSQVGSTLPAAIEDAQLMFDQHRLGNDGTETARSPQPDEGDDQMNENHDNVAHPGNPIKASKTHGNWPIH
jgi:hypothetical protein